MKRFCFVSAVLLLAAMLSASAFASEYAAVEWEYVGSISAKGTYPRLAACSDGTLLACHGAYISRSSDSGRTWTETSPLPAAGTYVSETKTHALTNANQQPYVLPGRGENGQDLVLVAYRCHTKNFTASTVGEFYTSLRVVTSTDGGLTFGGEETLIEGLCNRRTSTSQDNSYSSFRGYWEPMMIQIDDDTVALYYADDLSVSQGKVRWSQQIRYMLYNIPSGTWDKTPYLAIDGEHRTNSTLGSRDGMPAVTRLSDGSFAMVIEAHDYNGRSYISPDGTETAKGYASSVISLARSRDGKTWSNDDVLPIAAPTNVLTAGSLANGFACAAPYITTLPDGRVAISYHTSEDYFGTVANPAYRYNLSVIVSNEPLTYNSAVAYTTGGPSPSFTKVDDPIPKVKNGYQVWNSVSCFGGYLYALSATNVNGASGKAAVMISRANLVRQSDLNADGTLSLLDVLLALRAISQSGSGHWTAQLDYNADGVLTIADALPLLRNAMQG